MTGSVLGPAGRHGGDGPELARALGVEPSSILDLSQSLNPFAPDVGALVADRLDAVGRYPSPERGTAALADAFGVDPARLLLTNGGSEAIALVATELGGRVRSEPEFALHPRDQAGPSWRSDPHNPSGALADPLDHVDDDAVWDEAFYPLATGRWTAHRPGTTVGSLTKTFACPGLRIGYLIADDVGRFARHQPHWSVGSLALDVLPDLLEHCDLKTWSSAIADARRELIDLFTARGLPVDAADAPWVLVHGGDLRNRLAPHGILVRDCANFSMPGTFRVAVSDGDGLDRLAAVLDAALD